MTQTTPAKPEKLLRLPEVESLTGLKKIQHLRRHEGWHLPPLHPPFGPCGGLAGIEDCHLASPAPTSGGRP